LRVAYFLGGFVDYIHLHHSQNSAFLNGLQLLVLLYPFTFFFH